MSPIANSLYAVTYHPWSKNSAFKARATMKTLFFNHVHAYRSTVNTFLYYDHLSNSSHSLVLFLLLVTCLLIVAERYLREGDVTDCLRYVTYM